MNITTFAKRLCLLVPLLLSPAAFAAEMMPSPPQLAAKAYVLMDASSGNVLVENNGDQRPATGQPDQADDRVHRDPGNPSRPDR